MYWAHLWNTKLRKFIQTQNFLGICFRKLYHTINFKVNEVLVYLKSFEYIIKQTKII